MLLFPYTIVQPGGELVVTSAPSVTALPLVPTSQNVVLIEDVGSALAGMYQYEYAPTGRWLFVAPFAELCAQLFTVSDTFVCFPNAGDTLLPIGGSGAASLIVYRRGVGVTNYTVVDTGITLGVPTIAGDVFVVIQTSSITAASTVTGVPEAPETPTVPYVRVDGEWETLQSFLDAGTFVG